MPKQTFRQLPTELQNFAPIFNCHIYIGVNLNLNLIEHYFSIFHSIHFPVAQRSALICCSGVIADLSLSADFSSATPALMRGFDGANISGTAARLAILAHTWQASRISFRRVLASHTSAEQAHWIQPEARFRVVGCRVCCPPFSVVL